MLLDDLIRKVNNKIGETSNPVEILLLWALSLFLVITGVGAMLTIGLFGLIVEAVKRANNNTEDFRGETIRNNRSWLELGINESQTVYYTVYGKTMKEFDFVVYAKFSVIVNNTVHDVTDEISKISLYGKKYTGLSESYKGTIVLENYDIVGIYKELSKKYGTEVKLMEMVEDND